MCVQFHDICFGGAPHAGHADQSKLEKVFPVFELQFADVRPLTLDDHYEHTCCSCGRCPNSSGNATCMLEILEYLGHPYESCLMILYCIPAGLPVWWDNKIALAYVWVQHKLIAYTHRYMSKTCHLCGSSARLRRTPIVQIEPQQHACPMRRQLTFFHTAHVPMQVH